MKKLVILLVLLILPFVVSAEGVYIRVNAVGDVMPATAYPTLTEPPGGGTAYLKFLEGWLANGNPDFVFGNLEGAMTYNTYTYKNTAKPNTFAFRIPPEYAKYLKILGFNIMSIANNHSLDFSYKGFEDTKRYLLQEGIIPVGDKGKAVIIEKKGLKIAWLAFCWFDTFNSILNIEESMKLIRDISSSNDILIVSVHGGSEGDGALHVKDTMEYLYGSRRGNIVKFARLAIDNGADLVLGHGPHVPRALELYKNKLIAYSLGNFITYRKFSTAGFAKYTYILQVDLDKNGDFVKGKIFPFIQFETGEYKGIPRYDNEKRTIKLLQKLTKEDFPHTPLLITDEGDVLRIEKGLEAVKR